jgi:hypothetical protein
MWPDRSAYTMFWLGAAKSRVASRNSSQSVARFIAKTASAVRVGRNAVHASETA